MKFRGIYRDAPYVLVYRGVLLNTGLSLKARGLYALIAAWEPGEPLTISNILRVLGKDGRDSVNSAWAELVKADLLMETRKGYALIEGKPEKSEAVFQEKPESRRDFEASILRIFERVLMEQGPEAMMAAMERTGIGPRVLREIPNAPSDPVEDIRHVMGEHVRPTHRSELSESEVSLTEEIPPTASAVEDLFGRAVDEDDRETVFRRSSVGTWDAFKSLAPMRDAMALGIDGEHYFNAILSWSNRQSPRIKRNKRTAHGWLDTVVMAMRRDKASGKLKMVGTQEADEDAQLRFLQMGRE